MGGQGEMEVEPEDEERELFGRSDDEDDPGEAREAGSAGGGPPGAEDGQPAQVHEGEPHPNEAREPVLLHNPIKPSAEEVEKHSITHFRTGVGAMFAPAQWDEKTLIGGRRRASVWTRRRSQECRWITRS